MKCPVCNDIRMREVVKDGVMIDVCPDCKGVWLDRGELEKLMTGVRELRQEYDEQWGYVQQPYQQQGGYPPSRPAVPPGQSGYAQGEARPPYGAPQHGSSGYYGQGGYGYGSKYDKYGYDKYGRPYKKKKKNVLDVLGDLFD